MANKITEETQVETFCKLQRICAEHQSGSEYLSGGKRIEILIDFGQGIYTTEAVVSLTSVPKDGQPALLIHTSLAWHDEHNQSYVAAATYHVSEQGARAMAYTPARSPLSWRDDQLFEWAILTGASWKADYPGVQFDDRNARQAYQYFKLMVSKAQEQEPRLLYLLDTSRHPAVRQDAMSCVLKLAEDGIIS